jgi:uncharacterized membrane protein
LIVRRNFGRTSAELGVAKFGTACPIYLISAATTIVTIEFTIVFLALIPNRVVFLVPRQTDKLDARIV